MLSYFTSNNKTRLTTIDEAAEAMIATWDNQRDFGHHAGVPFSYNFDSNSVNFTYGTSRIKLEKTLDYERSTHKDHFDKVVGSFQSMTYEFQRMHYDVLTVQNTGVIMYVKIADKKHEPLQIPFEMINEVDFFQFETLGVVCPISAKSLTSIVEIAKGVLQ